MKQYVHDFIEFAGAPSLVVVLVMVFGGRLFGQDHKGIEASLLAILVNWGPFALVVLAIAAGGRATVTTVQADRQKAGERYYAVNRPARMQRAYYAFHKLYEEGEMMRQAGPVQRQQWDMRVRTAYADHLQQGALQNYLMQTGRVDMNNPAPLPEDRYDDALREIRSQLRGDFEYTLR